MDIEVYKRQEKISRFATLIFSVSDPDSGVFWIRIQGLKKGKSVNNHNIILLFCDIYNILSLGRRVTSCAQEWRSTRTGSMPPDERSRRSVLSHCFIVQLSRFCPPPLLQRLLLQLRLLLSYCY